MDSVAVASHTVALMAHLMGRTTNPITHLLPFGTTWIISFAAIARLLLTVLIDCYVEAGAIKELNYRFIDPKEAKPLCDGIISIGVPACVSDAFL
jgi:hypothetical protein